MKQFFKNLIFLTALGMAATFFVPQVHAASNIVSGSQWAWNDVIGWIDFLYTGSPNVEVQDAKVIGYASSSVGFIALDCGTTPNGNVCGGSAGNWWVANDGEGNLSGWAWSDAIGWISFTCDHTTDGTAPPYNINTCATSNYSVNIVTTPGPTQGDFMGWAWNDVVGWISFNCASLSPLDCIPAYKVKTSWTPDVSLPSDNWLISSTFDTCPSGIDCGAGLNTIMWRGTLNGGRVKFQIAASDTTGSWSYLGPTSSSDFYYTTVPGEPEEINQLNHLNKRYFRYKIFLESSGGDTPQSPFVEDVILNWSP